MSTLSADFLRATILVDGFKHTQMRLAQACLLLIGIKGRDFTGADVHPDISQGSRHLAGCACGALAAQGLIECVGRAKSPNLNAKGRKLDVWRIPPDKLATAKAWLRINGFAIPAENQAQTELQLTA